jgi:hypothetical protein
MGLKLLIEALGHNSQYVVSGFVLEQGTLAEPFGAVAHSLGEIFDSAVDVARHLGLPSSSNSLNLRRVPFAPGPPLIAEPPLVKDVARSVPGIAVIPLHGPDVADDREAN